MGVGLLGHLGTLYLMNWPYTASTYLIKLEPLAGGKIMLKMGFGFMMFVNNRLYRII
jgi:hypothetical protein